MVGKLDIPKPRGAFDEIRLTGLREIANEITFGLMDMAEQDGRGIRFRRAPWPRTFWVGGNVEQRLCGRVGGSEGGKKGCYDT